MIVGPDSVAFRNTEHLSFCFPMHLTLHVILFPVISQTQCASQVLPIIIIIFLVCQNLAFPAGLLAHIKIDTGYT
jgi:hypothetical protein